MRRPVALGLAAIAVVVVVASMTSVFDGPVSSAQASSAPLCVTKPVVTCPACPSVNTVIAPPELANSDSAKYVPAKSVPSRANFADHFANVLENFLGSDVARALYDGEMMNAIASNPSLLAPFERVDAHRLHAPVSVVPPSDFNTTAKMLLLTKQLMSVAVGRVHRDAELAALYTSLSVDGRRVFDAALRRVLAAQASYLHTLLQLVIDVADSEMRERLRDAAAAVLPAGRDPLVLLMARVTHASTVADVEALLGSVKKIGQNAAQFAVAGSAGSTFPLHYDAPAYNESMPLNGKFWNMLRPTIGCSTLVRLGEVADGQRLLCNAHYLLHARPSNGEKVWHRIVGFGSNNEFEWELSIKRMFDAERARGGGRANDIGDLTVFDCTVGPGTSRAWRPPAELKEHPIGFGHATKCLDGTATAKSVSMRELKAVLRRSERDYDGTAGQPDSTGLVTRYVVAQAASTQLRGNGSAGSGGRDGIAILKLDVEAYEHNALPAWARDELRNLAATSPAAVARGERGPIDFATAVDEYHTVSLFGLEFHRMAHKHIEGAQVSGALRAHYTLLHTYSLGYVPFAQEKNHFDNCCYELAFSHLRHYVRSEVWLTVEEATA